MVVLHMAAALLVLGGTFIAYRFQNLNRDTESRHKRIQQRRSSRVRLVIVLGSGGHTAEMLALLRGLDTEKYSHRSYVVSSGDAFSARKAEDFEQKLREAKDEGQKEEKQKLQGLADAAGSFDIAVVPRARRVHQSLWTTPFSSLQCLWACLRVLQRPKTMPPNIVNAATGLQARPQLSYPDLIITNGPGTGVIIILASSIIRLLDPDVSRKKMRTIYVESWARVRRLSLSGRILLSLVDRFIVQWEALVEVTKGRAEYIGVLV